MTHYTFTVQLGGVGHSKEEAWRDAVEGFTLEPCPPPDDEDCKEEEEECQD